MRLFHWWRSVFFSEAVEPSVDSSLQAIGIGQIRSAQDRAVLEARRIACSCSIIVDGKGNGTGFLIGDDLVITNYHVVAEQKGKGELYNPSRIFCRFGYYEIGEYDEGRHGWVPLRAGKSEAFPAYNKTANGDESLSLDRSQYLGTDDAELYDYAVLRLGRSVGRKPGRSPLGELNPLGWIAMVPDYPLPAPGQPLSVVEFPERLGTGPRGFPQEPSSIADGKMGTLVAGGVRACHDAATRRGASGSGIFDSKSVLVGLHNAGKERNDKTADNRFVPVGLIMADIMRRSPNVFAEISASPPPPLSITGLSKRAREAIQIRVRAAKTLLDREFEHAGILGTFDIKTEMPVEVNHIVCNQEGDEVDYFIERLTLSAQYLEGKNIAQLATDFLRGHESISQWSQGSLLWPDPLTPAEEAKEKLALQLRSHIAGPKTIIVVRVGDVDQREPAEELEYMRVFGEVLSDYAKKNAAMKSVRRPLQAVVLYELSPDVQSISASLNPLWRVGGAPQRCGVSISLGRVRRGGVQPWVTQLNTAWSPVERIDLPKTFGARAQLTMTEVFDLLDATIAKAAEAFVNKTIEDAR